MIWSFSKHRQFIRCQRQWYYKNKLAQWHPANPLRHEAYILSKLQSISAWRGNIVDNVISKYVVPKINGKRPVYQNGTLTYARQVFEQSLEFAKAKRYREKGMTQAKAGDVYCALYPIEYGEKIEESTIESAWNEVVFAITLLFQMDKIRDLMKSSSYLISQRTLSFSFEGTIIRAVPDLILFYDNTPPHIFDWKVHTFGVKNYREQLAVYAIALLNGKIHNDFPQSLDSYEPKHIPLCEIQLLKNEVREYSITQDDIEAMEDIIAESIMNMILIGGDKKYNEIDVTELATTLHPDVCKACSFKKLCWEEKQCQSSKQTFFLS
jgi:Fe-S cluster biosynthesis and repair protein YggX